MAICIGGMFIAAALSSSAQVMELDEPLLLDPLFTTLEERRSLDQERNKPPLPDKPPSSPPPKTATVAAPIPEPVLEEPAHVPVPIVPESIPEPEIVSFIVNGWVLRDDDRHVVWLNGELLTVGETNVYGVWVTIDEDANQPQPYLFWEGNTAGVIITPGVRYSFTLPNTKEE